MTVQNPRMKRALVFSGLALALGMIPLFGRIWLERHGAIEHPELGVVQNFVIRDSTSKALIRDQLRRSVSVVVFLPAECNVSPNCGPAIQNAVKVNDWIHQHLYAKWSEDKNPLILAMVGTSPDLSNQFQDWRVFQSEDAKAALLPVGTDLGKSWLIVIDDSLQFAARMELAEGLNLEALERVLSKTIFDQYLGNYLSKRTFFGPRRNLSQ